MASSSVIFAARVLFLALFASFAPPRACSSASSRFLGNALEELFRNKRDVCADGTYSFNERTCCRCAAGQFLVKDCAKIESDRICDHCAQGTYNSEPNSKKSCEPCTSCDQPDANLEVEEACTPAKNAKCRCKKDYYCESENCIICHPCQECDSEGIKSPCTATQNTVCNSNSGSHTGTIVGIVVGLLLGIAAGGGFLFWKKRRNNQSATVTEHPPEEPLLLKDVYRHLPEIADIIGWREMERLAIRSDIKPGVIESCKSNHPSDSQTQTQDLLKIWVEKQGKDASRKLIQMLNDNDQRVKAEDIKKILSKESAATSNSSV